jgi:hypothetical protein
MWGFRPASELERYAPSFVAQMIPNILADFRSITAFGTSDEVALFRNLAASIVRHSPSTFADETHGGKVCNVAFISVTGRPETCEIADLLILSVAKDGTLRATFWQAKKQNRSKWLGATTGNEHLDFDGQFNQWDLLSRRPSVAGIGKFQPPPDLLSSFDSASIGSFGVFYQRGHLVEMSHSVAEFVACQNPTVKRPKMSINGYLGRYFLSRGEIIARSTLDSFLAALFDMQVGALLNPAEGAHQWLVQYVRLKAAAVSEGRADLGALDRFFRDEPPRNDLIGSPGDGLSVLVVSPRDGA